MKIFNAEDVLGRFSELSLEGRIAENIFFGGVCTPIAPSKASDVVCPRCGSSNGMYLVPEKAWGCAEKKCISASIAAVPKAASAPKKKHTVFQGYTINEAARVIPTLREYATNPKGFLILAGENGVGKTHAARDVMLEMENNGFGLVDISFFGNYELYQRWLIDRQERGHDLLLFGKLSGVKLLVIDDFGSRVPTDSFLDFLYGLLNDRYDKRAEKGTILTTNLSSVQMEKQFGSAIFSRVTSGKCFKCTGVDRRRVIDF